MPSLSLIIPVYKPASRLIELVRRLGRQTRRPDRLILVNTRSEVGRDETSTALREAGRLFHETVFLEISPEEFDHGGTRNMAAETCDTDLIMFMTMDALPADRHLVEYLAGSFADENVACAYARQIPAKAATPEEQYGRYKSYPPEGRIKTAEDMDELGIRTFFCSDVCAAYRRSVFTELGGFEAPVVFNEDMIFAGRAVKAGYSICYCAKARVIHSHNYNGRAQFRRNFDLGASQADHPELFSVVSSEKEGAAMVKETIFFLVRKGRILRIPVFLYRCVCRYAGYLLGKRYSRLPRPVIMVCTMNRAFWKKRLDVRSDSC